MATPAIPTPSRRDVTRLVTLLSAGHLLAFVDRAKLAGAMPAIRRQIAMSDTAAGWVIGTAFALGYGVAILALAMTSRHPRSGWSWRLPAGVGLWAATSLATGLATTLPALIAARVLVGVGQALFIPAAISWIVTDGDRVDARTRGLATFTAASSLGRSLGLLAIGLVLALVVRLGGVGRLGVAAPAAWRWAFVLTALPNLALLALVVGLRRRETAPAPIGDGTASPAGWARPAFLVLALLPIIVVQAFGGWLPTLFVLDRAATPQGAAGWVGVLTLVGGTGSQLVAGWLMQHRRGWHGAVPLVIVGAMAATLPGMALVGWAPGAVTATIGVLLVNLTLGLAIFAGLFGWQQLTPAAGRVTGNGLFFALVTVVGVGLGPLVTGILADHGPALRWALMATATGCTVAAALVALMAQPLYRRHGRA